jgi:apolipoprotein D and lipocalin family protein
MTYCRIFLSAHRAWMSGMESRFLSENLKGRLMELSETKKPTAVAVGLGLAVLLTACTSFAPRPDLPLVPAVDLSRYAGTWYEIARLPMWFQRHCVHSKAVYGQPVEGTIQVRNECVTDRGTTDTAQGVARVVDAKTNARLAVVFDNWFARFVRPSPEGNYWILDLDDDYQTALVGTPDREYLWILARSPSLDADTYQRLVDKSKELGFPVEKLIRDQRT